MWLEWLVLNLSFLYFYTQILSAKADKDRVKYDYYPVFSPF